MSRTAYRWILLATAAALLYLSLYPWRFANPTAHRPFLMYQGLSSRNDWIDTVLNILVYVPIGYAGVLAGRHRFRAALWTAIAGPLFSLMIEYLQTFMPVRYSSWRDLITNSIGVWIGIGLALLIGNRHPDFGLLRAWRREPFAIVLAASWLASHAAPFIPFFRIVRAQQIWVGYWQVPTLLDTADAFVAFALLAWLLREAALSRWVLIAAWIFFAFEHTFISPTPTLIELVAAALGIAFGSRVRNAALLTGLLFAFVLLRQTYPFDYGSDANRAFSIIPLDGSLSYDREHSIRTLFAKFYFYGGTLWMAIRAGWGRVPVTAILVVTLLATEWAQRWSRSRSPEITDACLAVLAAVLMGWLASGRPVSK